MKSKNLLLILGHMVIFCIVINFAYATEIHLKDGKVLKVQSYWEEDTFLCYEKYGSTVRLQKSMIKEIRESDAKKNESVSKNNIKMEVESSHPFIQKVIKSFDDWEAQNQVHLNKKRNSEKVKQHFRNKINLIKENKRKTLYALSLILDLKQNTDLSYQEIADRLNNENIPACLGKGNNFSYKSESRWDNIKVGHIYHILVGSKKLREEEREKEEAEKRKVEEINKMVKTMSKK